MNYERTLQEAGLTSSESKVYLSLLRKGSLTKTPLVKESQISPSKVYEVINKLIVKGLVSEVMQDGIRHFTAASPLKIKEYLQRKKQEIVRAEEDVNSIISDLLRTLQNSQNDFLSQKFLIIIS